jgi:nitrogen fixation/metabolism regulation signal transduction histidine kinase
VWLDDAVPELSGPVIERHVRGSATPPHGALVAHVELDAGGTEKPIPVEIWAIDRTLHAALADLSMGAAALALGGLVLALFAGWMVARRIGARLGTLADSFDRVARGRRDVEVPAAGGDEVAELARHFGEMVGALSEAEQHAARAERVAAWREMAQHLAHELKNPLTPIQMSVETLVRARAKPDRAAFERLFEESAKVILDEVTRLKHIVAEFSRFARLPAPQLAAVDLRELCEAAATLYEGATPIERDLEAGLPKARADRDQLQQVLVNLLENAREAVAGQATPRVILRAKRSADRLIIEVVDNGPGIAESVRDRLFQPYATSKAGGTGLGLALVQRIVSEHGGRVSAHEGIAGERGPGACFRVELQVAEG